MSPRPLLSLGVIVVRTRLLDLGIEENLISSIASLDCITVVTVIEAYGSMTINLYALLCSA